MSTTREMVTEFHVAFNLPIRLTPDHPVRAEQDLRLALLEEEFEEYRSAVLFKDLVGIADALADMEYVIHGTALTYGIPLEKVMRAVHQSNMLKLGPDGKPIYKPNGKVAKPDGWQAPNIAGILASVVAA